MEPKVQNQNEPTTEQVNDKNAAEQATTSTDNRNVSSLKPLDDQEQVENFSGADSSLEKPKNQDR